MFFVVYALLSGDEEAMKLQTPDHKEKKSKYDRMIMTRVIILMVLFGFVMNIPLVYKLYEITILRHEELEQKATQQWMRSFPIGADRGTIYDRNMNRLAVSATVHNVCIAPKFIEDEGEASLIADGLSALLDVPREEILAKAAKKNRASEYIKRGVEKEKSQEVLTYIEAHGEQEFNRKIFLEPDTKRYYPNGNFASHIIGFSGSDSKGREGLEAGYDEKLTGKPGYTMSARDANGAPLPNQYEMYYDAQDGNDLVLSLDQTVQHFVEKSLQKAVDDNDVSQRASAIVMDVKTGGILAMATKGDYDLNNYSEIFDPAIRDQLEEVKDTEEYKTRLWEEQLAQWRNKAIKDTYEPGSTFKVFTAAMAIEEQTVDRNNAVFNCTGSVRIEGWNKPISCHKKSGHGAQTFAEALQHSCNPAFIKIGQSVGPERFYDYMRAFGFFDKTGIDLQGESGSIYLPYSKYSKDLSAQAVYSFGQTFKVTPLQMITAMCAVANGGNLMKPYVVAEVRDKEGRAVESHDPEVVRRVISEDTSRTLREYLEQCVNQGTGSNAYVKGYRVAGKTGTSQKRDIAEANDNGWYVVSFMGFAPADDPQIAVLVMLDQPGGEQVFRTGGFMAAPVAGRIFADTLPYLGVKPQYAEGEVADVSVPFLSKDKPLAEAKAEAEQNGFTVKVEGEGDTVKDQIPLAGSLVPKGTELVLYTEGRRPEEAVPVPDVAGLTPEEANDAMTNAGLVMRPIGAQPSPGGVLKATWQVYDPEIEVPYGQVVQVEFRNQNVADDSVSDNSDQITDNSDNNSG